MSYKEFWDSQDCSKIQHQGFINYKPINNRQMEAQGEPTQELTFGMKAVGINFNPSGDEGVNRCKMHFANMIDQMHALRVKESSSPETKRLASIAITEMQGSQMWAVKALTWKD